MAAAVEALSDSELRKKLKEYGIPEAPITDTTRKIFIKKLKQAIERTGPTSNGDSSSQKTSNGNSSSNHNTTSRASRSFSHGLNSRSPTESVELEEEEVEEESEEEHFEILTRTKAKTKPSTNARNSRRSLPAGSASLLSTTFTNGTDKSRERSTSPSAPAALVGLSDGELLKKLAEFGIPAGKITDITRPILMKKLNHAMVRAKKQATPTSTAKSTTKASRKSLGAHPTKYLLPTDTEEEDDSHFLATSTQNEDYSPKSRRRTIATSIADRENRSSKERSPTLSFSMQHSFSLGDGSANNNKSPRIKTPSALGPSTPSQNALSGLTTGLRSLFTDQTSDKTDKPSPSNFVFKSPATTAISKPLTTVRNRFFEEQEKEPYETGSDTETEQQYRQPRPGSRSSPTAAGKISSKFQLWTSNLGSLFHNTQNTPTASSKRPVLPTEIEGSEDEDAGPRVVGFAGLKPRQSPFSAGTAPLIPPLGGAGRVVTQVTPPPANNLKSNTKKEEHFVTWQVIAIVLPILALLFFVVLGLLYLSAKYSEPHDLTLTSAGDVDVLCRGIEAYEECVEEKSLLDVVRNVLPSLTVMLQQRAGAYVCGNLGPHLGPQMSRSELSELSVFSGKLATMEMDSHKLIDALFTFVSRNPQKGIKVSRRESGDLTLEATHPAISWGCAIQQRLLSLFFITAFIAGGVCVVYLVQKFTVVYWTRREQMQQETYTLVEAIIDLLSRHHAAASEHPEREKYLAVNHVRDLLIPPSERKSKSVLWEKAVQFLEENESRVRVEVQPIQGEEFRVWRWLPPSTSWSGLDKKDEEGGTKPRAKVWQGQAFTTGEGAYNAPPIVSPTPCLKIRNMFDAEVEFDDTWPVRIQDAILEKADKAKILHIAVDRASREGCVYAKCTNQEEAGNVYRALHGWWFDGKLVTVKFLRIERYHERFPDARSATLPLQPSNNQRLSLQTKYWKSPLEHF